MIKRTPSTLSLGEERPAWAPVSDAPVIGLRVVGGAVVYPVPAGRSFTLGTQIEHDVVIDDPTVSGAHCIFDWRGRELWLQDLDSKNGTYVNGVKVRAARIIDGSVLVVGRTTLVAFSFESRNRRGRDELLDCRDPAYRAAADLAITAAMRGETVVLVGEPGSGRETIARAIHEVAVGPHLPFVRLHLRKEASRDVPDEAGAVAGTLFVEELASLPTSQYRRIVDLMNATADGRTPRPEPLRIVVSAREQLWPSTSPPRTTQIRIPPLRERGDDVRYLFEQFFRSLVPAQRALPRTLVAAIRRYSWPGNVSELKEAARRLAAIAAHGSVEAAAESLAISKSSLSEWLKRRGLPSTL